MINMPGQNMLGFPPIGVNAVGPPGVTLGASPMAQPGLFGTPTDFAAISAEATSPEASIGGLLSGLSGAYGFPGAFPMDALQQQLMALKSQMAMASDPAEQQQLEMLLAALLAQLMGQGETAGASPSAAAGGAPPAAAPPVAVSSSGYSGGGGSSAAPSGGGGGSAAPSGGSSSPSASTSAPTESSAALNAVPPKLAGDDKQLAQYIEKQLQGSPLAGQGMGAHFVKAGRQNDVDPMALVAISKHETNFGKLGVGVAKHMGVGAFDSSPGTPRQWDGATNQVYSGAKTFANLRSKGGSNSEAPLAQQLSAVNKAGWATDSSWHSKVGGHYNEVTKGSKKG